jgi:hypothetical protein
VPRDGFDILRRIEQFPKLGNAVIQIIVFDNGVRPYGFHESVFSHQFAGVLYQEAKSVEEFASQADFFVATKQPSLVHVEDVVAKEVPGHFSKDAGIGGQQGSRTSPICWLFYQRIDVHFTLDTFKDKLLGFLAKDFSDLFDMIGVVSGHVKGEVPNSNVPPFGVDPETFPLLWAQVPQELQVCRSKQSEQGERFFRYTGTIPSSPGPHILIKARQFDPIVLDHLPITPCRGDLILGQVCHDLAD